MMFYYFGIRKFLKLTLKLKNPVQDDVIPLNVPIWEYVNRQLLNNWYEFIKKVEDDAAIAQDVCSKLYYQTQRGRTYPAIGVKSHLFIYMLLKSIKDAAMLFGLHGKMFFVEILEKIVGYGRQLYM